MSYIETVDWNITYQTEHWRSGEVRVTYQLPKELTEEQIRENMIYWSFDNIWGLFKIHTISPDLMR